VPYECVIPSGDYVGQQGIHPPNVIGLDPSTADARIRAKALMPVGEGDLYTGTKGKVREQSPDSSQCVLIGSTVYYKYRLP
jgi:hypothetical protein